MPRNYTCVCTGGALESCRRAILMCRSHRSRPRETFCYPIHEYEIAEQGVDLIIRAFQEWIVIENCTGEDDPRCLPFHVFDADIDTYNLSDPSDRQRFQSDHRGQRCRRDGNALDWRRPNTRQMHGRASLQVAGRDLIRGFHWDVSDRTGSKRVSTTSTIWQLRPGGYFNIYPDAHIRGSRAIRIFPPRGKKKK